MLMQPKVRYLRLGGMIHAPDIKNGSSFDELRKEFVDGDSGSNRLMLTTESPCWQVSAKKLNLAAYSK